MPKNTSNPPVNENHVNDVNAALDDVHLAMTQIPKKAYSYGAMQGADRALAALEAAVQSARYRIAGSLVAAHSARTPLQEAVEGGKLKIVRMLLSAGASVPEFMEPDEYWKPVLESAGNKSEVEEIQRLVRETLLTQRSDPEMEGAAPAPSRGPGL